MDTTYFGRSFGVMLFKDALTGKNLLSKFVKYETNQLYYEGLQELITKGLEVIAVVCDGRRGLFSMFKEYPIQMCQFHQIAIITKYLTRNPKLEASKELRELSKLLTTIDKDNFEKKLKRWYEKWSEFLNERSINPTTKRKYFTHKRLRSAYTSLKRNLPYLFTYQENSDLKIPNTTNSIDGHFADLKSKLRVHNGLSIQRKKKFIIEFLKA